MQSLNLNANVILSNVCESHFRENQSFHFSPLSDQRGRELLEAVLTTVSYLWHRRQLHIVAGSELKHVIVRLRMLNTGFFSFKRNPMRLRVSLRSRDPLRSLHLGKTSSFVARRRWHGNDCQMFRRCAPKRHALLYR